MSSVGALAASYRWSILRCIEQLPSEESLPWSSSPGEAALGHAIAELRRREGSEGVERVKLFYLSLLADLEQADHRTALSEHGISPDAVRSQAAIVVRMLDSQELAVHEDAVSEVAVLDRAVAGVAVRVVGPAVVWDAEICRGQDHVGRGFLYQVADYCSDIDPGLLGYLIQAGAPGEGRRFSVMRVPDRAGSVTPISRCRQSMEQLFARLVEEGAKDNLIMGSTSGGARLRTVVSLEEDYEDRLRERARVLLGQKQLSLEDSRRLVTSELDPEGDLYGELQAARDLRELRRVLNWSRVLHHQFGELREFIGEAASSVVPVDLLIADRTRERDAFSDYFIPAAAIESSDPRVINRVVQWAEKTHQRRVYVQDCWRGETFTLCLPQWEGN